MSQCKKQVRIEATIWDNNNPIQIRYHCSCNPNTLWKDVDDIDKELIAKINKQRIPYWYPNNELVWNSRVNVSKGTKVSDLFTKRNLHVLSAIYDEILGIRDSSLKRLFQFCFTASLGQASKLVFVYETEGREKDVGGWATRGFWTPPKYFEINAWSCFEERFSKLIRGKIQSNTKLGTTINEAQSFSQLTEQFPFPFAQSILYEFV